MDHGKRIGILNILEKGTKFGEREINQSRFANKMKKIFGTNWFYKHGAPKRFSTNQEF